MNKFTPLNIEILVHYSVSNEDWKNAGGDCPLRENCSSMQFLWDNALITDCNVTADTKYMITPRGRAVIEYMCNTPMPTQEWKFPERGEE